MTTFDWAMLVGLGIAAFSLAGIARSLEISNRHLSNIADRLLDIEREMAGRSR